MLRINCQRAGDEALLSLANSPRRALACVLADWLNIYAGVSPGVLRREHFELVVELRHTLLAIDEWATEDDAADPLAGDPR